MKMLTILRVLRHLLYDAASFTKILWHYSYGKLDSSANEHIHWFVENS